MGSNRCRIGKNVGFPEPQHGPSIGAQLFVYPRVALDIRLDLCDPILPVVPVKETFLPPNPIPTVPKFAVAENGNAVREDCEIRSTGEVGLTNERCPLCNQGRGEGDLTPCAAAQRPGLDET